MDVTQGNTDATSAGALAATVPGQVAAGLGLKGKAPAIGNTKKVSLYTDVQYREFFDRCFREAMADRWIFERQWTRAIHYNNNRQWLAPYSRTDGWRDARLAKGIPTPVTNKAQEADQAIRAMLAAINFGVMVRPAAQNSRSIATAQAADNMAPLMHDVHNMDDVMNEGDFWFVNCGNVIYHSYWDYDAKWGSVTIPYERCAQCKLEITGDQIALAGQKCPQCGGPSFVPVLDPATQKPRSETKTQGCGQTVPLSLLEVAFPIQRPRWDLVPFVIKMRWRTKREFEENPDWKDYLDQITWARTSTERSLQIFQTLPLQNDMGSNTWAVSGSTSEEEGVAEYELWHRPTREHPEGLVLRMWGDGASKVVAHCEEEEGLPGEIPYKDAQGRALYTFTHAAYQHVGGRVIGKGVHDSVFKKYDQLNRLDALVEMIAMRMASPQWMIPKGAEVEWLGDSPGLPGLLLQWNAQLAGENGRPERSPGIAPDAFFGTWRKQIIEDIEESQGTYDILRGAKPAGVEAFAAMQLLVERGESRFASAFKARGRAYRDWFKFSLELERQFGPVERVMASLTPAKGYAFQTFKRANLAGDVTIVIEDGTYTPKTSLGERAAIEHLSQLQVLPKDPDTTYSIFQKFGQTSLIPAMDAHVSAALKKQESFENWVTGEGLSQALQKAGADQNYTPTHDPTYPLIWRRWYDPQIHRQEFLKWANGDTIQQLLATKPQIAGLLEAHLVEIDFAITEKMQGMIDAGGVADQQTGAVPGNGNGGPPAGGPVPKSGGAGRAMANSNTNATTTAIQPGQPQDGRGGAVPPA